MLKAPNLKKQLDVEKKSLYIYVTLKFMTKTWQPKIILVYTLRFSFEEIVFSFTIKLILVLLSLARFIFSLLHIATLEAINRM